jgi:type II secretory pathway pseudopilin PulG
MKTGENTQRSTFNAQRPRLFTFGAQRPASGVRRLPPTPHSSFLTSPSLGGFTLFELLGVLTLIGVVLVVLLGAYGSWGTAHAINGAANVLTSGLQQARTLARTSNEFIAVRYGTETTNETVTVSGFQIYLCTNDHALISADLGAPLRKGTPPLTESQIATLLDGLKTSPGAPFQRISGHVRLAYQPEEVTASGQNLGVLVFRPDGSVWSASDTRCHYLCVYSKELFAMGKTKMDSSTNPKPLTRILRVDLATGTVTVIQPEVTP